MTARMPLNDISADYVRNILDYDPETGVFLWKHRLDMSLRRNVRHVGRVAGGAIDRGYIAISIDGRRYKAHRLAWLIMTGEWPAAEIDHQDGNTANNAWSNLRSATRWENLWNSRLNKTNKSGFKGVHFYKQTGKFQAFVWIENKGKHLGYYETADDAAKVVRDARDKYHGEFARHR